MAELFDTYLFADWSASDGPKPARRCKDAPWVGELGPETPQGPDTTYHRTRQEAAAYIARRLAELVERGRRVLIGFDFPYGFPAGTAAALGLARPPDAPWQSLWQLLDREIEDSADNRSNRWQVAADLNRCFSPSEPGPFWGCPATRRQTLLTSKRKGHLSFPYAVPEGAALAEKRLPEKRLPGTQEVWKLYGAGSVGSQALVGIPYVHRLRHDPRFAAISRVWPFETGFAAPRSEPGSPAIVHAEIWPGIVEAKVRAAPPGRIRDQVQVETLCLWARLQDRSGRLAEVFDQPVDLATEEIERCLTEEGWILGA